MPISKGEFARRRNVSPGRVSQWIAEGKISGAAIVGEGRSAQIDEVVACAQLNVRLDPDQRHSANGLSTNVQATVAGEAPPLPINPLERQLLEHKVIKAERENREAATEEATRLGQLVEVDDARRRTGQEVARAIARCEGTLPEFANALAAKFKIPARDALHELRTIWRRARAAGAIEARERAEPLPERTGFDLDPDREC